jgi:hypothetical protein
MGHFHCTSSQLAAVSLLLMLFLQSNYNSAAVAAAATHNCALTLTPSKVGYNSRSQHSGSRGTSGVSLRTLVACRKRRYQTQFNALSTSSGPLQPCLCWCTPHLAYHMYRASS